MSKKFDFDGYRKAFRAIAKAYKSEENARGVSVGVISNCEYEFLLMMNGKWVNVIEMLSDPLGEKQKTYCTASAEAAHVALFWAMVEDLRFEEVVNFLTTSDYCRRFAMLRDDLRIAMPDMSRVN